MRGRAGPAGGSNAVTTNEKIGLGVLVSLFVVFCAVLVWTFQPVGGEAKDVEESIFVQQRVINLQKDN